ncbi:MAG: 16S rRNA (guanine(527)-N(7))-methyltransferase RsmG [Alphaproteobacteria bacterium]
MWPSDLLPDLNVSRESIERLEIYHALLLKWQKAINLVSGKTLDEAWVRHFADSAQIVAHIPDGVKVIADMGSGAGFPALVVAILRPDIAVHVIESDERKCQFMRTVSRETGVSVRIHTSRIESVDPQEIKPDLITARALASVVQLFDYSAPFLAQNPALQMLFLKGAQVEGELREARELYDFGVEQFASVTNSDAAIVRFGSIKKR